MTALCLHRSAVTPNARALTRCATSVALVSCVMPGHLLYDHHGA